MGFIGDKVSFLLLVLVGGSRSCENVDVGRRAGHNKCNVGEECEMGMESNSSVYKGSFPAVERSFSG